MAGRPQAYPAGRSASPARSASRVTTQSAPREGPAGRPAPSTKAVKIVGSTGKYSLINGIYEPLGVHGNHPYWTTRNTNPCYLFHTGKTRWVISKALDDGTTCYAFITDDGGDTPASCKGPWTRCDDKGQWKQDPLIKCTEQAASKDPFVAVRLELEDEMKKVGITDDASRQQLWRKLDRNGDGTVDVQEIEALVTDLTKNGTWPAWLNQPVALQRAYKQTLQESIDGDDQIEKEEFHALLLNIFWFGKLDEIFQEIDTKDDGTVDKDEFAAGLGKLGVTMSKADIDKEFKNLDASGDGIVDFGEFCLWVRTKVCPDTHDGREEADDHALNAHAAIRDSAAGDAATAGTMVRKKNFADFDKLEKQIKAICDEPDQKGLKKLWSRLDFNGNNIVSLAEIDKWVVEQYPLLNHKPALIRAQQATLKQGNGNDWVEKKEFKMLVANLFYYNKLFWLFDQADEGKDRRMDFKEFQWCLSMCNVKLSQTKAQAEFAKIDKNGGGLILFDEFCSYFTEKQCPQAMTAFIADE